ncbi:class II fructose-bisphosphate aldolase [Acetoanaerobium noterae]|uniref:class II fructose-bisphosphate aldolase n=1 Tax=Acetoanaerobium noterae TaxID=745369 RepID=UPI0028AB8CAE|nr:class II fructose-bisphosphate aldolase [Acetoanaerobium noterae]
MDGRTLQKMIQDADKGGYAIPSFNYSDIWDLMAIIEAAEELNAPIMFAANQIVAGVFTPGVSGAMGKAFMANGKVPLIHHLDHSKHVDLCLKCIDNGYPSVMIDGSDCDLATNIKMVQEVMSYAKADGRWVHVEAEVGRIPGQGVEGYVSEEEKFLVEVEDVITLVKATNVDSLAVGIGSQHGFYKGTPKLNIQRLDEVNAAVDTPLVLHGGSGIPRETVREAIRHGINKMNVGTIIHCTYMNSLRAELNRVGDNPYTLEVMAAIKNNIKEVVKEWIDTCMDVNRV